MRVVLATAEPSIRDQMRETLVAMGHDVTEVADGAEALDALRREQPALLVVADDLPTISGLDVCRAARADAPTGGPFVLVITSDEGEGRLARVLDAGADDFLLTTASLAGLRARVSARTAIAARRMGEDAARRRAESALARTQRLVGINEAASALQHEINNPLAALLAHADLLAHGLHEPGEERELLDIVVEQARRIADVVKRIAALRYPQSEEYVPNDGLLETRDQ
jgi:DNA-binding response OmpR family regulator